MYLGAQNIDADSETGRQIISANAARVHQEYDPELLNNDIAVVEFLYDVSYSSMYNSWILFQ